MESAATVQPQHDQAKKEERPWRYFQMARVKTETATQTRSPITAAMQCGARTVIEDLIVVIATWQPM